MLLKGSEFLSSVDPEQAFWLHPALAGATLASETCTSAAFRKPISQCCGQSPRATASCPVFLRASVKSRGSRTTCLHQNLIVQSHSLIRRPRRWDYRLAAANANIIIAIVLAIRYQIRVRRICVFDRYVGLLVDLCLK